MNPEIRQQIKRLGLQARHHLDGSHHGAYLSKFKGTGMDFNEYRPYIYGDDIKHIDWKVTAKSTRPHIRLFKEERDLCIALLIDISSSMYFGSQPNMEKITKAVEIACYFITLAAMHQDRSCLFLFADDIIAYCPPRRNEIHAHRTLMQLLDGSLPAHPFHLRRTTHLEHCLKKINRRLTRRAVCILISDFFDNSSYQPILQLMAQRHEFHGLRLLDPLEKTPPQSWFFTYKEPESELSYELSSPKISPFFPQGATKLITDISTQTPTLEILNTVVKKSTKPRQRLKT